MTTEPPTEPIADQVATADQGQTALAVPLSTSEKVAQIVTWILEGRSDYDIREAIAKSWPADADNVQPLILAAGQTAIESAATRTHESVQAWAFERTRYIYEKLIEIGEYGTALRALRQMVDLSAARTKQTPPPQQIEHTHHHEIELGPITNDNLDQHKQRLARRIACIGQHE